MEDHAVESRIFYCLGNFIILHNGHQFNSSFIMKKFLLGCLLLISSNVHAQFTFTGIDAIPGMNGLFPRGLVVMNNRIYFIGGSFTELGTSDGTVSGTYAYSGIFAQYLTPLRDSLVFMGNDTVVGVEPFISDGTPGGTHILKDINNGSGGSNPGNFVNLNNQYVFFGANSNVYGRELWRTDGTDTGTVMIADINPGLADAGIFNIAIFNNQLYFGADDGIHGYELWTSDGTTSGTHIVADLNPGPGWSNPCSLKVANNKLYFGSSVGTWVSDGTAAGTDSIYAAGGERFIEYHGEVYFTLAGYGIYKTDGTQAGTNLFLNSTYSDTAANFIIFHDKLFFTKDGKPWYSDGTVAGSFMLTDSVSNTRSFRIFNDRLFFVSFSFEIIPNGDNLYVSNGTPSGTNLINPPTTNQPNPLYDSYSFQILDSCFFFMAGYDDIGHELWKICGTDTNFSNLENLYSEPTILFPNPATDFVNLASTNEVQDGRITIFDLNGKLKLQYNMNKFDISTLASGIYIVELLQNGKKSFHRMIKQ
jgi:ELWxxDGT repeat protein